MNTAPPPTRPADAVWHPKCGTWWTGTRTAHCPACCATFSGASAFDLHQRNPEPGELCRKPRDVGLVPGDKRWGVMWSWPASDQNPWGSARCTGDGRE